MDRCWVYDGHLDKNGYGKSGGQLTHRAAYEILVGPIPDGCRVAHLCPNRACYNPSHLEPVIPAERLCECGCGAGPANTTARFIKGHGRRMYGVEDLGKRYLRRDGYVEVCVGFDRHSRGWMLEHRVVAAEMLGRELSGREQVHHRNRVRSDNRPENLEVVSPKRHALITAIQAAAGEEYQDFILDVWPSLLRRTKGRSAEPAVADVVLILRAWEGWDHGQ